MNSDATLFQRADNIKASWAVLDDLLNAWANGKPEPYEAGSDGRAWLPIDLPGGNVPKS
ncbi:MAG: hypothetical protein KKF33_10795 [Alphaproteobacteria bacterium]|nr:hypothetical protein [Alphaproteobacteria bacterium]